MNMEYRWLRNEVHRKCVPDAESALGKVIFLDDSDLWFINNISTISSQHLELFDQNWFRL